jgi:hypothetical protein
MTRPGWLTDAEAVEKYGKDMLKKMGKTGYLDCVAGIVLPDGQLAIPERDYELACRAVKICARLATAGERIHPEEWD